MINPTRIFSQSEWKQKSKYVQRCECHRRAIRWRIDPNRAFSERCIGHRQIDRRLSRHGILLFCTSPFPPHLPPTLMMMNTTSLSLSVDRLICFDWIGLDSVWSNSILCSRFWEDPQRDKKKWTKFERGVLFCWFFFLCFFFFINVQLAFNTFCTIIRLFFLSFYNFCFLFFWVLFGVVDVVVVFFFLGCVGLCTCVVWPSIQDSLHFFLFISFPSLWHWLVVVSLWWGGSFFLCLSSLLLFHSYFFFFSF